MSGKTHWKKLNNPDYIGAYALEPGEDMILEIASVREERYTGMDGKKEDGIIIRFAERNVKPMICNATNAKSITKVVGSPYIEDWKGHKIQLYATMVSAFGNMVEALRVREFQPKLEEYICQDCGCTIVDTDEFLASSIAKSSSKKFGKTLCMDCAKKEKERIEKENKEGDVLNESNEDQD